MGNWRASADRIHVAADRQRRIYFLAGIGTTLYALVILAALYGLFRLLHPFS